MQITKITNTNNYSNNFNGIIKVKSIGPTKKPNMEVKTTLALDKGLSNFALKTIFNGDWSNRGNCVNLKELDKFADILRQTLDLKIPHINKKEIGQIELKHLENGYSIKVINNYELTHLHDDFMIFE